MNAVTAISCALTYCDESDAETERRISLGFAPALDVEIRAVEREFCTPDEETMTTHPLHSKLQHWLDREVVEGKVARNVASE